MQKEPTQTNSDALALTAEGLKNRSAWEAKNYRLPAYDRAEMIARTRKAPYWIHFGAGNIFRAFQANVVQRLLNDGTLDRGLTVAEGYDYEIVTKMNQPHDDYSILVTLKADGSIEKTVVGSVAESLALDTEDPVSFERLKDIFKMESLQMASFTITEKGYALTDAGEVLLPAIAADFSAGPGKPESYLGKVAALLYARFCSGEKPLAMVSMDNCSHNGDKLRGALMAFARAWTANGLVDKGFSGYVENPEKVSFPWTMIDKITPRPDASVEAILKKDGLEDPAPVVTAKNTYIAPFVNAEECEYLVIEDSFPNGRPALEKGGLIFTDRATVEKVERMKVCTCLNPLHTALAVFGCLMGYDLISKEMEDPTLKRLVERIGYTEGLPVVTDPGILDPREFLDAVLNIRIPNPFMPDTPQRIATDTSQKLAIRYGETIKAYVASPVLDVADLTCIPLVFAGWLRYLMGVDDNGQSFTPSPDPLLAALTPILSEIKLGQKVDAEALLAPILSNTQIFGVDLCKLQMSSRICSYFTEMIAQPGAIRATLKKYI